MVSPYSLTRPGGVQGQAIGLATSLRRLGHEVTVVAPADDARDVPAAAGAHFVVGPVVGVHANGSVAPLSLWPAAAARAERFVRHGRFDVAHLHEPLAPVTGYGLALARPVPLVGTFHRAGVSRTARVTKPLLALALRRLSARIAVSEAARDTAERSYGGRYEVLFNGVDVARFASATPLRDEQGVPVVLFLGRHEARKGLDVLLDAFAALDRPAVLWVVGEGPGSESARRRHPPSDRVRWLGRIDDAEVAGRLAGADVLCAPSLSGESFGVVLLEAMASGCAVVASDLEGYRAAAGGHAALVPPGDVGALTRALDEALADAAEGRGRSSDAARAAAGEYARAWSMDALAERYLEVYERVVRAERGSDRGGRRP